tara:strand:+ start:199 stop:810 length:612 start_codon:yes stop_codon:yes gene_type:complete
LSERLKILKNIAILISGTGSNMEAIINDTQSNNHPGIVKFVLSNRSDALGLLKAQKLGIKTFVFPVNRMNSLEIFEKKLLKLLIKEKIDLICLAGFMKVLSQKFLSNFKGDILNIHPSILPSLKGLNTHKRILEKKSVTHGATVHKVIPELDSGKILGQTIIKIKKGDTPEKLAKKLIKKEHYIYIKVIRNLMTGKNKIIQID